MNKWADYIIPECYVDTNLVETLVCHAGCNHQKGCNQVCKVMQEKFADRFAVGIIDADKRRPGYMTEFNRVTGKGHLEVFRHRTRPHFLILVHPAIEGFILSCVEESEIDMTSFGFTDRLKDFTKETKNVMSNKDGRFKALFHALEERGEAAVIKSLIEYFCNHTYRSSDTEISTIFLG